MADWHDDARHVPLFEGALLVRRRRVVVLYEDGSAEIRKPRRRDLVAWNRPTLARHGVPDLTDPLTAYGALRLLALRLGAPTPLVEQVGLMFAPVQGPGGISWGLVVGLPDELRLAPRVRPRHHRPTRRHREGVERGHRAGDLMGKDKHEGTEAWGRLKAHAPDHNADGTDPITDPRWYGKASSDPSDPTPVDGDGYFNTTLKQRMVYDGTRSKWLTENIYEVSFAAGAALAAAAYLDFHGQTMNGTNGGIPAVKGTLVSLALTRSDSDAATIEVTRNGTAIAELATSAAGITRDDTLDVDFDAGLLAARVKTGSNAIDDLRVVAGYRGRA